MDLFSLLIKHLWASAGPWQAGRHGAQDSAPTPCRSPTGLLGPPCLRVLRGAFLGCRPRSALEGCSELCTC